jgi:hypothetical protein
MMNGEIQQNEIVDMRNRITEWLSAENMSAAIGKTREEIFEMFGNELMPIAYINSKYLPYLDNNIVDNRVYSGMGYFIDHAVNHHLEVSVTDYSIQEVLSYPDNVYFTNQIDKGQNNKSLIFVKKMGKRYVEIIALEKEYGKLVIHKSFFYNNKKNPYKDFTPVRIAPSLTVGISSNEESSAISPDVKISAGGLRFSALNDNANVIQRNDNSKFLDKKYNFTS